jgi:hypothetical protein
MGQSSRAAAELGRQPSDERDGLTPSPKAGCRIAPRDPRTQSSPLLELCVRPLRDPYGDRQLTEHRQVNRLQRAGLCERRRICTPRLALDLLQICRRVGRSSSWMIWAHNSMHHSQM